MYTKEEKQFIDLRNKFLAELQEIDKQILNLELRKEIITSVLNGNVIEEPEETVVDEPIEVSDNERIDERVLTMLEHHSGSAKRELDEVIPEYEPKVIERSLKRLQRRGLAQVIGKAKNSRWHYVKQN